MVPEELELLEDELVLEEEELLEDVELEALELLDEIDELLLEVLEAGESPPQPTNAISANAGKAQQENRFRLIFIIVLSKVAGRAILLV